MADEFLPIMMFRQRTVDEDRVEGRGQKEKPKWVLTGADLVARSHSLVNDLVNSYSQAQHNIELPYIYEVTLDKRDKVAGFGGHALTHPSESTAFNLTLHQAAAAMPEKYQLAGVS